MKLLAQSAPFDWTTYAVPIVASAITVLVLLLSVGDVSRFRFARVRAIAGICFTEAIRRRVLWITPLAIIGIISVSQLTRPLDAQDAVRQTIKYCLFATGLVTVLTAILLACANLPKEIESRVIFTIVTKPTTRLEIVLGKVMGFAMVSGIILLIMGLFTLAFLEFRATSFESQIKAALASGQIPEGAKRANLQRYADQGLLRTKSVIWPAEMQVFAKEPSPDGTRWAAGGSQTFFVVPFVISEQDKAAVVQAVNAGAGPVFSITLKVDQRKTLSASEKEELASGQNPTDDEPAFGPALPTSRPSLPTPRLSIIARAQKDGRILAQSDFAGDKPVSAIRDRGWVPGGLRQFVAPITTNLALEELLNAGKFNLEITGLTPTYEYGVGKQPVSLSVYDVDKDNRRPPTEVVAIRSSETETVQPVKPGIADLARPEPPGPRFYSRFGRVGMQVSGRPPEDGDGPVAVYSFRGSAVKADDDQVTLQTKISIDRSGDLDADRYKASVASVTVRNVNSGFTSPPAMIEPDTNRLIDIRVPFAAVDGGDFDVLVRGRTPGQSLGLHGLTASVPSIALVEADHWFGINLFKGLLLLWMLSILVVTISVFCSTFLSWPIAVVLTLLLLMGRWGVNQLGDSLNAGASRSVVQDLFKTKDATKTRAVTDSLEALSSVLRNVAPLLPDVNQFPLMEDLDRGVSIPIHKMTRALLELLVYGVPLLMLTYVVLKRKEVAP
ncbi:ABC transporter permease [Humisphaera borealis]|uniref:ABC transporter permease n=1 Tax=Humisphaera borealis TaxID=2807512 RepID=A0A7M2X292_9BACT|nr:ABC transporter permease [Humisphaera borealis]QOV91815.1 ABC transporter permease [Humisphaera borealis]